MDEIALRVKDIIAEELQVDKSEISDEASLADLGGDSLKALALVSAFESNFDISIPDEDVMKMNTIQSVIDIVKKNLKRDG
ncbi:MAG: acyl carrier protein [Thermodesulfovibrionales bacterium]|nr:acyl carrier protein [Thermodesulfovibrionales bacterium]